MPENLPEYFARRVAERDNPPPPPPLSPEPAAVQARIEDWLLSTHHVRDPRGRHRLARMVLALMQQPECTTGELATAAGLHERGAARMAVRLGTLDITTWEYRGYYRYHRLEHAAEDSLLRVVLGPASALKHVQVEGGVVGPEVQQPGQQAHA